PIGDAASVDTRTSAVERHYLSRPGLQNTRSPENRGSLQQRMARQNDRGRHDSPVLPLPAGAHVGARGFPVPHGQQPAAFDSRADVSAAGSLRFGSFG